MKNEVYNMDCIEYMRSLPDNAFDIAVCDPPYGKGNDDSLAVGGGGRFGQLFKRYYSPVEQVQRREDDATLLYPLHKATGTDSEVVGENAITHRFQGGTWATRYKVQTGGVFRKLPLGMLHHRRSFSTSSSVLVRIR